MFLGVLLLMVFLSSLPWVWLNVSPISTFAIRPSIIAAIPLVPFYIWKAKINMTGKNIQLLLFLLLVFFIWFIPSYFREYPHWSSVKVLSIYVYAIFAYCAAQAYLMLSVYKKWKYLWPIVVLVFIASIALSYNLAFGTLIPDMKIKTSDSFIHSSLYGQMDEKGIRHTMAIIPVILLAMVVHNKTVFSKLNLIIVLFSLYLILYSFSRAAWLAAFLIVLLYVKLIIKDLQRSFIKYFMLGSGAIISIVILMMSYPAIFNWAWNIISDRVTDDRSTGGRLSIMSQVFSDMGFEELLFGYDRYAYYSPHNMMLDAFMQSGFLGLSCAMILVFYTARIYLRGLFKGGYENIIAATFVAPAFVRMFSAGSGMLHLAELFGLFIAVNIKTYINKGK